MGGKTSTHVYNSYDYAIYVRCDSEKMTLTETNFQCEAKGSAKHELSLGKLNSNMSEEKSNENIDLENQTNRKREESGKCKFESKAEAGASINIGGTRMRRQLEVGFTKIQPGGVIRFDVDCTGTKHVYITIYDEHDRCICENHCKREDKSIIIDTRGQVVDTKYHEKYIAAASEMQAFIKQPESFAPKQ